MRRSCSVPCQQRLQEVGICETDRETMGIFYSVVIQKPCYKGVQNVVRIVGSSGELGVKQEQKALQHSPV